MSAQDIIDVLATHRFCFTNEEDLQDGLADALRAAGVAVDPEIPLNARDRIDFVAERVGIEVKFTGAWRDVYRQLRRYLESPLLDEVLLVTVKANHRRIPQGPVGPPLTPLTRKRLSVHQITTSGL